MCFRLIVWSKIGHAMATSHRASKPVPRVVLHDRFSVTAIEQLPLECKQVAGHEGLPPWTEKRMRWLEVPAAAVRAAPVAPDDFPALVVFAREAVQGVVGPPGDRRRPQITITSSRPPGP